MTGRLDIETTPLIGLTVIRRKPIGDGRGFLERMYCASELLAAGLEKPIRQINRTFTSRGGTVRGLHYQEPPAAETKIVTCLRGRVYDIALDLRAGSPTFLRWFGIELSAENHLTIIIPEGFAHGLQTLEDDCEMLYLHTADHVPAAERGISATDPKLGIEWPLPIAEMSDRDRALAPVAATFEGVKS
jgi:dTDP-4-dehydrorhamnose 3,5-epimerase